MIGYVTIGSSDLERSRSFFDALLKEFGAARVLDLETGSAWSTGTGPSLMVLHPFDGGAPAPGNGTMVALACATPDMVSRVHARALELGGRSEGGAGWRTSSFYAAYFRDPDGNKFNAFYMGSRNELN